MYSFPLENEQDEIEKEKEEKEKEELEKEEIKEKTNSTSHLPSAQIPYILQIPIIIGSILCFVVLLDMIVLFAVPYQRIQANKRKLPDAHFEKPNKAIIWAHFILHILMISIGVLIILYGFRGYKHIYNRCVMYFIVYIGSAFLTIWFIVITIEFITIPSIYPKMTTKQLISILNNNPPINFAFIYSKCVQSGIDSDDTYYSKNGIIFPMKTNITSPIYNFTDTPEMFFFVIDQKVNMSYKLKTYFNQIFVDAYSCDRGAEQKVEYYPKIKGDYIVLHGKLPTYLNKATRIASILFGVGVYYELNFKSIPYITYVQYSNADIVQGVNYKQIFTPDSCENYGKCSHSDKPHP